MKPAPFDYVQPDTVAEALDALAKYGEDAKILAGGQSLVPMLNMRLLKPSVLVDISRIESLRAIEETTDYIEVGAAVTQVELEKYLAPLVGFDLLKKALPWVGHYQTRQTGTVCGSLVHSDPSSELPLCLKMLGGEVRIHSAKTSRMSSADSFQVGLLQTDVMTGEFVTSVRFPRRPKNSKFAFREISQRHGDFAIVAVAAEKMDQSILLGVGGVADTPTITSLPANDLDDIDDTLNEFAWELRGTDDVHASASYRRELVRRLGKSLIQEVLG